MIAAILVAIAAFIAAMLAGPLLFESVEAATWSGLTIGFPAAAMCAIPAFVLAYRWGLRYLEIKQARTG
jgi:hypothetical protein